MTFRPLGPLGGGPHDLGQDPSGLGHALPPDLPGVGIKAELRLVPLQKLKLFGHVIHCSARV